MLHRFQNSRGFSLIEMAIVLLIAGLLIAGAFQLINNMQQQRSDQATANETRIVIAALERFLHDQQSVLVDINNSLLHTTGSGRILDNSWPMPGTGMQALAYFREHYLPTGLDLTGYKIGIQNMGPITGAGSAKPMLKGLVLRTPTNALNEARRGRIASLIGSQGGLVVQNSSVLSVNGVQGSWSLTSADVLGSPDGYGFVSGDLVAGQIAAYTTTIDAQMNTNVLSRIDTGNDEANTMRTHLNLGQINLVKNAAGYSLMRTNATIDQRCDTGTTNVLDVEGNPFPEPKSFKNDSNVQNALVLGRNSAGSNEILLRCQKEAAGSNWFWRSIASPNDGPDDPRNAAYGTSINAPYINNPDQTGWLYLTLGDENIVMYNGSSIISRNPRTTLRKAGKAACFWSDGTGGDVSGGALYRVQRDLFAPGGTTVDGNISSQICPAKYYVAGVAVNSNDIAPAMAGFPNGSSHQRAGCGDGSTDCTYIYCCPFNPDE